RALLIHGSMATTHRSSHRVVGGDRWNCEATVRRPRHPGGPRRDPAWRVARNDLPRRSPTTHGDLPRRSPARGPRVSCRSSPVDVTGRRGAHAVLLRISATSTAPPAPTAPNPPTP